jgi:hypothetical protein
VSDVLLLNVTAMAGESVCVAGIDLVTKSAVRFSNPQPTRSMLKEPWLRCGHVIEVSYRPSSRLTGPHVEDADWDPQSVRLTRVAPGFELNDVAFRASFGSVEEAFGKRTFNSARGNAAWPEGQGPRSLACVRVRYIRLFERERGKLRAAFRDEASAYWHDVPVQDAIVRTHGESCLACRDRFLANAKGDFEANACVIRVGLTRAADLPDYPRACWLQVTNVLARPRRHFVEFAGNIVRSYHAR